jgi:hypothetical protein
MLSACLTVRSLYLKVNDGRPIVSRYVTCVPTVFERAGNGAAYWTSLNNAIESGSDNINIESDLTLRLREE